MRKCNIALDSLKFEDFINNPSYRKYEKFRLNTKAEGLFKWLCKRSESLFSAVINHKKPALQGVIVELEEKLEADDLLPEENNERRFFITMIGSMVRYILSDLKIKHVRTGVPLRHSKLIKTASTYTADK